MLTMTYPMTDLPRSLGPAVEEAVADAGAVAEELGPRGGVRALRQGREPRCIAGGFGLGLGLWG